MKTIILKFSGLLLFGLLFNYLLLFYSPIDFPENIPYTPINIGGLAILIWTITVFILLQKRILELDSTKTIVQLVLYSTLICFIAELFFQIIRFPTIDGITFSERIFFCIKGIISIPLMCMFISFFVALQLKTKKIKFLIFAVFIFLLLFWLLLKIFNPQLVQD